MKVTSRVKKTLRFSTTSKIIATISAIHLGFIILIDKVTAFAPDEANYIGVFNNLYKSNFSLEGYLGWQEGSINVLRLIYLPAKILEVVGFSDFYAVRILSLFYSMLSLYLLLKLASNATILKRSLRFWITSAYLIPSVFLWSSLGLRESFIFFSFISVFYLLANPQNLSSKARFTFLLAANSFLLVTKSYLFALLLICLLAALVFLMLFRRKLERKNLNLSVPFLIPLLLFPSITADLATGSKGIIEVQLITPRTPEVPAGIEMVPTRGQTLHDLNQQLDRNPFLSWIASASGFQDILDEMADASYLPAGSTELSENVTQLQTQPASLRDPLSLLVGAYNFLFVPTPFVDNGSFFLNAQSYESFAWYFYYLILILLLIGLIRRHYVLNLLTLSSTLFSLGFVAMSALIEINDGTSVRHRAILLIGILVMLVTFQRKQPDYLGLQGSRY